MYEPLIDFHAHILPGVDHGSDSLETSLKQIKSAKENGIKTIVATSHFYPHLHHVEEFLEEREAAYQELAPHLDGIQVVKGAELQLCVGLDRLQGLEKLCIENTNVLLIEMPDMTITREMYETLQRINMRHRVVIAHVDRYSEKVATQLLKDRYMLQLNAMAFQGLSIKWLEPILESGQVWALGSDIHGADRKAYTRMKRALRRLGDQSEEIQGRMQALLMNQ